MFRFSHSDTRLQVLIERCQQPTPRVYRAIYYIQACCTLPESRTLHPYTQQQRQRNQNSRNMWQQYTEHRRRVTGILRGNSESAKRSVCVWGAGNGNDLDLNLLVKVFSEVHLVDLDHEALLFAVEQQSLRDTPTVVLHGGVDLLGAPELLAGPSATQRENVDVDSLLEHLRTAAPPPCQRCDVVASVCLLSQLIEVSAHFIGPDHPRLAEVVSAVRCQHLRRLLQATHPSGRAIFITEILSSDTFPELPLVPLPSLKSQLAQQINLRNFFTGLNPAILESLAEREPEIGRLCNGIVAYPPWRWDFGPRTYAVAAYETRATDHG